MSKARDKVDEVLAKETTRRAFISGGAKVVTAVAVARADNASVVVPNEARRPSGNGGAR